MNNLEINKIEKFNHIFSKYIWDLKIENPNGLFLIEKLRILSIHKKYAGEKEQQFCYFELCFFSNTLIEEKDINNVRFSSLGQFVSSNYIINFRIIFSCFSYEKNEILSYIGIRILDIEKINYEIIRNRFELMDI